MTQYNALNLKWSNSQINKLKPGIKSNTEVKFHQILLVILIMRIIFCISYY